MVSDNILDFVSQVEGCGLCLGNDNILAVYLCPAAGRGMQYTDDEFALGFLKTRRLYLGFPKDIEKRHRSFSFFKSSCLEISLNQDTAAISYLLFLFLPSSKHDPNK